MNTPNADPVSPVPGAQERKHKGRVVVSVNDAVQICGVSRRTIYNWIAAKRITVLRMPSGIPRFYADELLTIDAERQVASTELQIAALGRAEGSPV